VVLSRTLISGDTDIPERMLIFCHLCIGSILGLHLFRVTGNRRMVALATLGSIIPDLVDKPLGYLAYGDILGHGRLYLHTLLLLLVLACLGVLAMHLFGSNLLAIVTGLIGLHQVMDLMWLTPVTWFYPFLGAFPTEAPVDLGGWLLAVEAGSLSEWVFLGVLVLILLSTRAGDRVLPWGSLALLILGLAAVPGLVGLSLHFVPDETGEAGLMMLALVSFAGSLGLWLLYRWGEGKTMRRERGFPP
jgi:LexA-binding, inner membrane-associated putative hydrolase